MAGPDDAQPGYQVLSLSEFDSKLRDYKKRKSHKKTTSGCLACKAKRVKVWPQLHIRLCSRGIDS